MKKKLALALAASLATGTAAAAQTPHELLVEWGYLSKPVESTPIVEFAPIEPRDAAEAYLLSHGFPVVRTTEESQKLLGHYVSKPAEVTKNDTTTAADQLLIEWGYLSKPAEQTSVVEFTPFESDEAAEAYLLSEVFPAERSADTEQESRSSKAKVSSPANAAAVRAAHQLMVDWGYLSKPTEPTPIVEFAPTEPRDAAEAYLLSHGFPVIRTAEEEQELLGSYVFEPAKVVEGDAARELLVKWDYIKQPTSFSAIYVPNGKSSS